MFKKKIPTTSNQQFRPPGDGPRLSPKWTAATMDDVANIIEAAQRAESGFAEQQWTKEESGKVYLLSCSTQKETEPLWKFSTGGLTGVTPQWEYATGDISLIHSLVASEWGESIENLIDNKQPFVVPSQNFTAAASPAQAVPQSKPIEPGIRKDAVSADEVTLQGDLVMMQLPNILQSIQMSNMSGRLALHRDYGGASLFFENGSLVHAENGTSTGDGAVIEILGWQTGKFHFKADERTSERTVKNQMYSLLMQGMTFADQSAFLTEKKLTLNSYLVRTNSAIQNTELAAILSKAAPIEQKPQTEFYWLIDDCTNLMDLLRIYPLREVDWVPIIFNLVTCDLVTISQVPVLTKQNVKLEEKIVDQKLIGLGIKGCLRPETGILTFPAFLYFANHEFERFNAGGQPFSLIVFNVNILNGSQLYGLPEAANREMLGRISALKRPFEMFGHFETLDYALLLPQTELKTAALVAQRMIFAIKSKHLFAQQEDAGELQISLGVAGVPEDAEDLGALLGAAAAAKKQALSKRTPVVVFRTMLA